MKTIIAGTDFSPSSENACKYAAMLANKLNCKLTLFNLYEAPLIHTNVGLYGVDISRIRKSHEEDISKLSSELKTKYPTLKISQFVTSGSFSDKLEDLTNSHQIEAVVMGLKVKDRISKYIFGSHGVNLAGKIKSPVIIVPEKYVNHKLSNLVLAVDNSEKLFKPTLRGFEKLIKTAKAEVDILYIRTPDELFNPVLKAVKINQDLINVKIRKAKDINLGIKRHCQESPKDMIAIVSKRHSVLYNMFNESHTQKIAYNSKIPVMAIHE